VSSGQGRSQFDQVRDGVDQLRALELEERDLTRQRADRARRWVSEVMLINIVSLGGLTIAMVVLLRRWVTGPLASISEAVREVAGGSLRRSIPTPGPPELAGLGADVDAMRRRILAEVDTAARAQEALAQEGLVALTLRSQLAPDHPPLPCGLAMADRFQPAEGVLAGDWYDVVTSPNGRLGLMVVDVAGHGAEAGIFALRAKQLLVAAVRQDMGPGEALNWVAEQFGDTGEMFLTCLALDLDPVSGHARYANAGHPAGLVRRGDRRLDALGPTGPLLGPLPGRWATRELTLAIGDLLVAYTDGITEARNPAGEQFGLRRLSEVVVAQPGTDVDDMAAACVEAVVDFTERRMADDLTVVVLSRTDVAALVPNAPAGSAPAAHE
ncbi:MAG: PP2C family protein-serine/threonine phosphatase, partial [Acidimicrobiales bacterium]